MKVVRLQLRNYRRYLEQDIELPDGVTALIGRNGSGKSTLLEALGFALYGAQAVRTPKALLRSSEAAPGDAVQVMLELELGGQAISIVRELRGENLTPKASLTVDGKPLVQSGANSNKAVTEEVERLLGMDRHAFFTTIVAQQKELARLADLAPNDRKQLILRMLGIDAIDRAIQSAREQAKRAADRLDGMRSQLADGKELRANLAAASAALEASAKQATEAATEHSAAAKALERAQAEQAKLLAARTAHDAARQSVANWELKLQHAESNVRQAVEELNKVEAARAALAELAAPDVPALTAALDAAKRWHQTRAQLDALGEPGVVADALDEGGLATQVEQARKDEQKARAHLADIQAEQKHVANHLRRLQSASDDAPCPVCQRPMEGHLPTVREEAEAKHLQLSKALEAATKALTSATESTEAVRKNLQAAQRHNQAREVALAKEAAVATQRRALAAECQGDAPDLSAAETNLARAQAQQAARAEHEAIAKQADARQGAVTEAQAALVAAKTTHDEAKQALAALGPPPDLAATEATLGEATQQERAALQAKHNAEASRDVHQREVAHAENALATWKASQATVRAQEEEARYWTALAGGRGRGLLEQFRSHMVGRIRPAINQEASRLLALFTNGRYAEMLLDDDYNLYVRDEGVAYTASRFSGGETDLVHLALRLAVSRLLAERSGAPELRFLALDEVFGSLDESRRASVLAALHGLGGLYSQVLLVTHHEGLRDALDGVLEVRTVDNVSVLHQA